MFGMLENRTRNFLASVALLECMVTGDEFSETLSAMNEIQLARSLRWLHPPGGVNDPGPQRQVLARQVLRQKCDSNFVRLRLLSFIILVISSARLTCIPYEVVNM